MRDDLLLLKKTKLFDGIQAEEIEAMLRCLSAVKRSYGKEESVFRVGERISSIALLLSGCVHIRREDYWGKLSILGEIAPGELFGEAYATPGSEAMVNNAVAVENSTVLFLDLRRVLTVCPSSCRFHAALIQNLFIVLAEKNRRLAQKMRHMSQRTTRDKLLSYLSEQSLRAGSSSFELPFNRQQLADFLSVDRSAMSNELCKMRDEGLLAFERNRFTLKKSPLAEQQTQNRREKR